MASLRNKRILIAPGEQYDFPLNGDSIRLTAASVPIYFKTREGDLDFYLNVGEKAIFHKSDFLTLIIYHLEVTNQSVIISVGKDAEIGSALISGAVSITSFLNNGAFNQNRISLTNVNQQILAANANRKYLLIQNNDPAAIMRVNLAGVAATATQGFRVAAGASLELNDYKSTAAINVMMEAATGSVGNVEFAEG